MKLVDLHEDIEIELDEWQTLLVHFADEGIVYDVWDKRVEEEPVYSDWKLYSEFMQDLPEGDTDDDG